MLPRGRPTGIMKGADPAPMQLPFAFIPRPGSWPDAFGPGGGVAVYVVYALDATMRDSHLILASTSMT